MRVAILYDAAADHATASPDTAGVHEAVAAVHTSLGEAGHTSALVGASRDVRSWLSELDRLRPDVVFNLCEGLDGRAELEAHAAAVVELLGLRMTGAPAEVLAFARRKDRLNALLEARGIPVPIWAGATAAAPPAQWDIFPAIVKPAGEDASVGISRRSVARDGVELARALAEAEPFGALLVQEFLGGRELNVGIVGDVVLPVSEIDYSANPPGEWPLVCYTSKWSPGSLEDLSAVARCPAELSRSERDRANAIARAAWLAIGGRGYGRVDLRADGEGRLHVLEVNPNPDLSPSCGLARMALAAGWSYTDLVERVLAEALA